jgi:hypothetical protein
MTHCLVNHHITGHLVLVLVNTERFIIFPAIDNPVSCEMHHVMRFLHLRTDGAEIRRELYATVYGQSEKSEGG